MNSNLSETLVRIEHKLDILLAQNKGVTSFYKKLREPNVICPLCDKKVTISVDPVTQETIRNCGCSPIKLQSPVDNVLTPEIIRQILREEKSRE